MIKKLVVVFLMLVLAVTPIMSALNVQKEEINNDILTYKGGEDFDYTHTVLAEYGTTTSCPHCPPVSGYLFSIYESGYDFYFVSLVANMNSAANTRCNELGISGVPDVHFDGGYTNLLGNQGSNTPYINAINTCGARSVSDIGLDIGLVWNGNNEVSVTVNVTNNEGTTYNGHLHAYVTEKESRWCYR
jgi:hypothetical protein